MQATIASLKAKLKIAEMEQELQEAEMVAEAEVRQQQEQQQMLRQPEWAAFEAQQWEAKQHFYAYQTLAHMEAQQQREVHEQMLQQWQQECDDYQEDQAARQLQMMQTEHAEEEAETLRALIAEERIKYEAAEMRQKQDELNAENMALQAIVEQMQTRNLAFDEQRAETIATAKARWEAARREQEAWDRQEQQRADQAAQRAKVPRDPKAVWVPPPGDYGMSLCVLFANPKLFWLGSHICMGWEALV